jgi:DNA-binding NarL/FixJ family response regulator
MAEKLIEQACELKPDVAVLDLTMPEGNGFEATRQILSALPNIKVIILTVHESEMLIQEARNAGAHGYVLKSQTERDLISAIQAVLRGEMSYPVRATPIPHRQFKGNRKQALPRLTARQSEILKLLAQGFSNEDVAARLGISVKTVETHRRDIFLRTNCHSTAELVRYAIRNRLIEP